MVNKSGKLSGKLKINFEILKTEYYVPNHKNLQFISKLRKLTKLQNHETLLGN